MLVLREMPACPGQHRAAVAGENDHPLMLGSAGETGASAGGQIGPGVPEIAAFHGVAAQPIKYRAARRRPECAPHGPRIGQVEQFPGFAVVEAPIGIPGLSSDHPAAVGEPDHPVQVKFVFLVDSALLPVPPAVARHQVEAIGTHGNAILFIGEIYIHDRLETIGVEELL